MTERELEDRVLSLLPEKRLEFVLGVLAKVTDERDQLRTSVILANNAAEAAAEAIGAMTTKLAAVMAERDQLQDEIAHIALAVVPNGTVGNVHDYNIVPLIKAIVAEAAAGDEIVSRLMAERDRLQPVVTAAREFAVADAAWHDKVSTGAVRSTDDESQRRVAAIAALLETVHQLEPGRKPQV